VAAEDSDGIGGVGVEWTSPGSNFLPPFFTKPRKLHTYGSPNPTRDYLHKFPVGLSLRRTTRLLMRAAQHRPFQRIACRRPQCARFNSTVPSIESSRIYCQNLLRRHDYASYLQSAFIPAGAKDAHLAIRALNIELALIPDTVSNQNARIMRMQFWKDALDDCYKRAPKAEPVSILLAGVLASGTRLTKSFFQTMISERVMLFW